jgi:hypothetical protein
LLKWITPGGRGVGGPDVHQPLRGVVGSLHQAYAVGCAKIWADVVHPVIRTYSGAGATKLFDLLEQRKSEVEALIRPVKGFVSYSLIRGADGGASVTVCQDKAGTDESLQIARDWIGKNASDTGASPPTVVERVGDPASEIATWPNRAWVPSGWRVSSARAVDHRHRRDAPQRPSNFTGGCAVSARCRNACS